MATTGDGLAPSESDGAGERFQNSTGMPSDQGENSSSTSATTGISELEQTLKQLTFTRSKIEQSATMDNLPNEILIKIFIRLLAKQLAQMRCVSKSWKAILSQPSFVKSHLHRSIHNNHQQVLLVFSADYSSYCERFTTVSSPSPSLEFTDSVKLLPTNDLPMRVIGSINGLICLSKMFPSSAIHIWKPSLSVVSTLPSPHFLPTGPDYATAIRFGFDPKADDYKLVKLTGFGYSRNVYTTVNEWLQVQVYSMKKGSWEYITQPFPPHITRISNTNHLYVDGHHGHLHWQDETVSKTERTIVAFDLSLETFREIPLPHSILHSKHIMHRLGVLGGKLCEMSWCWDGAWEVWVMEEYGMPESWVKRHVLSQFNYAVCPYGFTSCNELLLRDKDGRLVLYDPVANKTKFTHTKQKPIKIMQYVDSLVWV